MGIPSERCHLVFTQVRGRVGWGEVCAPLQRHVYRENKNLRAFCSRQRQGISCCIVYIEFSLSSHLHWYSSVSPDLLESPLYTMVRTAKLKPHVTFSPVYWSQAFLSYCLFLLQVLSRNLFKTAQRDPPLLSISFRCICLYFFPSEQFEREVVFQNVTRLPINATVFVS